MNGDAVNFFSMMLFAISFPDTMALFKMKTENVIRRSVFSLMFDFCHLDFIEMEDLLASFHEPCIMDCKIGVRTYLEEDLDKSERDPEPRAVSIHQIIEENDQFRLRLGSLQ